MKKYIIAFLFLFSLVTLAQDKYVAGYIVLSSGEKESGFIYDLEERETATIKFKNNRLKQPVSYEIGTLKSYFLEPNQLFLYKLFAVNEGNQEGYYFQALVLGEVNLYKKGVDLFIENQNGEILILDKTKKETFHDGKRYLSFSNEYIEVLNNTLDVDLDFPTDMSRVRLDEISLMELIMIYNQKKSSIEYTQRQNKPYEIVKSLGFSYGGGTSTLLINETDRNVYSGNFNANNTFKVQPQLDFYLLKYKKIPALSLGLAYRFDRFLGTAQNQVNDSKHVTALAVCHSLFGIFSRAEI
jgi:hypothetical protein